MKMDRKTIEGLMKKAIEEREKARIIHDRQQGAVNLCEWLLQNVEFDLEETQNGAHVQTASKHTTEST